MAEMEDSVNKTDILEAQLNSSTSEERLNALRELIELEKSGLIARTKAADFVNNHIHTTYSFSPYSPAAALYYARKAGLLTAGIMDHDSVGGCKEFKKAGEIASMSATCGFECRVHMSGTFLEGKRINNPDQKSIAYVAMHGIPNQNIEKCEQFLAPFRQKRNIRNRKMTDKINLLFSKYGLALDYYKDIVPLSMSADGGSITERHILYALSKRIIDVYGRGFGVVDFLRTNLKLKVSEKIEDLLSDKDNPYYEYDLLGALKSDLVSMFYIDATDECPHVTDFIRFAKEVGGISAYAYLGDVASSVTGDKKIQKFEDDYIDKLFEVLHKLNFNAVTYMPSRNTMEQLLRIISLCERYNFFEISGEDINSPRQSFLCEALGRPEFEHLGNSTWALIRHEELATADMNSGMFCEDTAKKYPIMKDRVAYYSGS
jgi:hypothetical protein